MTHDELLEYIDFVPLDGLMAWMQPALQSVVKLHKPEIRYAREPFCSVCYTEGQPYEQADDVYYPCPTIQAIEAVLND
jgi:hypothetical protein